MLALSPLQMAVSGPAMTVGRAFTVIKLGMYNESGVTPSVTTNDTSKLPIEL